MSKIIKKVKNVPSPKPAPAMLVEKPAPVVAKPVYKTKRISKRSGKK